MLNDNMMGDFEDIGDDLVDTDSFVNHRGAGEEPFYVPNDNESDSSGDDNDVALDWSRADLSAIMDELELLDDFSEDDQKDFDLLRWNLAPGDLGDYVESDDEDNIGDNEDEVGGGRNSNWEDCWYDHPYGNDFVQDFHCLQNSPYGVRNDLLDMLEIAERSCRGRSVTEENKQSLNEEVQDALNDILIPGMSKEGLRKLHNLVLREPTLNLKKYLENADPYFLAYIIWGLNFYLSRHAKGDVKRKSPRIIECGTQGSPINKEEVSGLPNRIYTLGLRLLCWICDIVKGMNIGSGYEDIIRQISPLIGGMRLNNGVEYIRK